MAKDKIVVSTIVYGDVEPLPYASHCNLWYRLGRDLPEYDFIFHSPWRVPIDTARNQAVLAALQAEAKYLFFYDSDMVLQANVIKTLLSRDKPAIMAMCWIRGYPFPPMVFHYDKENKAVMNKYEPTSEDYAQEIIQCDAIGTPCTLINVDVFKHIPEPWFLTGKYHTEDVYFCCKAREYVEGFECWVDLTVPSGHLLDGMVLQKDNVDALRRFHAQGYSNYGYVTPKEEAIIIHKNPFIAEDNVTVS